MQGTWRGIVALSWVAVVFGFHSPHFLVTRHSQTVVPACWSPLEQSSCTSLTRRRITGPRLSSSAIASNTLTEVASAEDVEEVDRKIEASTEEVAEAEDEEKKGLIEEFKETVKKYGVAGVLALAVEVVAFNIIILLPATLFVFHQQSGLFIPTPATSGKFYGALGSVYLFCKFPPIEAARFAFAFKIIPWVETKMPEEWRSIDLEEKWKEITSPPQDQ